MKMESREAPRWKAVLLSLVVLLAMSCGGDSTGPAFTFKWRVGWVLGVRRSGYCRNGARAGGSAGYGDI